MKDTVRKLGRHPATWIVSVVGTVASTLWLPIDPTVLSALAATLWTHSGTLFSAGSALAFASRWDILGGLSWLQPIGIGVGASGALLFAARKLDSFLDDFQDRL